LLERGFLQYRRENYVVWNEVKLFLCFIKHVLGTYGDMVVKFHAFVVLRWIEMNGCSDFLPEKVFLVTTGWSVGLVLTISVETDEKFYRA